MSSRLWSALFELRDSVDASVTAAAMRLRQREADVSPTTTPTVGLVLAELHVEVRSSVERCIASALEPHFTRADAGLASDVRYYGQALRLVAYWVNERVRSRLPVEDCGDWLPVGPSDAVLLEGGRRFFREIEPLTSRLAAPPPLSRSGVALDMNEALAELALFILEQGFEGLYAGQPVKLEEYKRKLRRPREIETVIEAPPPPRVRVNRYLWGIVGGLSVTAFYGLCVWISHAGPG